LRMVSRGTIIYVAALGVLIFWAYFVQADTRRVDGHSMLPTLEGGDLVVIQGVSINDIQKGDIIVYNGLCSSQGESVIHRVINVTNQGLITKGDNNPEPDQYRNEIANGPITQRCLEGRVVFVIPYVELLAYYIDANQLPQWFNYIPSLLILIIVIASIFTEKEEEDESGHGKVKAGQVGSKEAANG
jgi:signal peptidase I